MPTLGGIAKGAGSILETLIGDKYRDKVRQEHAQLTLHGPLAIDYLSNPNTAIMPDQGDFLVKSVTGLLPKAERERFEAFVAVQQHAKELAAQQKAASQQGPQFQQGSPAPQAQAVPQMPQPPGMPQMAPPPGNPPQPLPGSSAGQPGNGAAPIVPQDPTTPGNPSQGFTSLGVTPATAVPPPPSEPLLRHGNLGARTPYGQAVIQQPAELLKAQTAQQVYETRFGYLRKQGLNDTQIVNILGGHPGAYEPVIATNPGQEVFQNGRRVGINQQPRIVNTAPGGVSTAVPVAGAGGIPAPPGSEGSNVIAAPPLPLPRAMEGAKRAYIVSQKAKNPSYEWSDADLPKAVALEKEMSMSPTERIMKEATLANLAEVRANRKLNEANLALHMQEFRQTKGPEAIDAMAGQIYANPETVNKLTGDAYNLVAQRYQQKYGMPMPRELATAAKDKDDASKLSFNHVQGLKELVQNPVIQKRMGAWDGRLGNLEQTIGDSAGLSDADKTAIQQFRTRIPYLFGQEARAVMGRPAQKYLDELKEASPRMSMGLPLFMGALQAVEDMAKTNILTAEEARNGARGRVRPEVAQQYGLGSLAGSSVKSPRAAPPPGKIEVKRKSDGRMGFMDEHDFNPTLYEKVNAR